MASMDKIALLELIRKIGLERISPRRLDKAPAF